jgi:hypothetical protein
MRCGAGRPGGRDRIGGRPALTDGAPGRYVELGWAKSAGLALVAVANVAGNFRQPDPARFGTGVPAGVSGLSVAGDGWAGIAVGASSAPAPGPPRRGRGRCLPAQGQEPVPSAPRGQALRCGTMRGAPRGCSQQPPLGRRPAHGFGRWCCRLSGLRAAS